MDFKDITFSNLTPDEEKKLKKLEEQFLNETGKSLYLLAFNKK